ncbi:chitin synthase [Fistulifera solaris]|uniref:chitin synthase n=1 Tax=Fistulifera solaris TaxID=1519565 RepID=A0A1Z5JC05_FISSO|nr:chitin synthase [Fistulifera solaris]|eukprot:GAX11544.1 chitin synthase [Fistulifera solaris]
MFDIDKKAVVRKRQAKSQLTAEEQQLQPPPSKSGNGMVTNFPEELNGSATICGLSKSAPTVHDSCSPTESSSIEVSSATSHGGPFEASEKVSAFDELSSNSIEESSSFTRGRISTQPHTDSSALACDREGALRGDEHVSGDASNVSSHKKVPSARSTIDVGATDAEDISQINRRQGTTNVIGSPVNSPTPQSPQYAPRIYHRDLGSPGLVDEQRWDSSGRLNSSVTSQSQMPEYHIVADHENASLLSGLDYSIVSGRKIQFGSIAEQPKAQPSSMPTLADSFSDTSSKSEDALVSLARAMREQAAVIQAMAGQSDEDELSRLAMEKRDLAQQVLRLQQEIEKMEGSRQNSMTSVSSRGSGRYSARSVRSQRSYKFAQLGHIPEVVTADEMTTFSSIRGPSVPGNMPIPRHSHRLGSVTTDELTDGDLSTIPSFENVSMFDSASVRSGGSRRSKDSRVSNSSRPSRASRNSLVRRSRMSKEGFEPDLPDYLRPESPPGSQFWRSLAFLVTFFIPDVCIPVAGAGAKQAWREKVLLCMLMFLSSAMVVGGIGFLPIYFCRNNGVYSKEDIWQQQGEAWITIFGMVYDMDTFIDSHVGGRDGILQFLGGDASKLFPRLPAARLPSFCLNFDKGEYFTQHSSPNCTELTDLDIVTDVPCHDSLVGVRDVRNRMQDYKIGNLVIPGWRLGDDGMQWIRIGSSIYNVTQYVNGLINNKTQEFDFDEQNPNAFLSSPLHRLVTIRLNSDVTSIYNQLFSTEDFKLCLDELFYEADYDERYYPACEKIGIMMYTFLFVVAIVLGVQVFCSLVFLFRKPRTFTAKDMEAGVVVMMPCYNEGPHELQKTIDSVVMTKYPEENRVMVIVADGWVTGADNRLSTPEILSNLLGFEMDPEEDTLFHYRSLGKVRNNFANVYAGVYEKGVGEETKSLKYLVVVKRGGPEEAGSNRAGNRGKRDSQLILLGMYNRIHHNRKPSELDMAIVKGLFSLGLPAKDVEYLMVIDADTRVDATSIPHMIYSMEHDKKILACCGETQVDNKAQSWVTMIQVYEYFSSHHLKKAFESVFGCVTCLPGCFTMYRILTTDMRQLIGHDDVYRDYARNDIPSLHEKNLYELGEDRMLTTLLLRHFPAMRLSFVPEALCWTIVPHNLTILLSQRRRWINSTFHNMYELLKIQSMCGVFLCSMKLIVFMDLLITMILPASLVYISYLTYLFITEPQTVDRFVLIFYAVTFSLQMVSFLSRSRWDYMLWFLCFCILGIPVFYFLLPIYAFLHMDDFSWGKTRAVGAEEKAALSATTVDGENFANSDKGDEDEDESEGLSTFISSLNTPSTAMISNVHRGGSVSGMERDNSFSASSDRSVKTWSPGDSVGKGPKSRSTKTASDNSNLSPSSASGISKLTMPSAIDPKKDFDTFRFLI